MQVTGRDTTLMRGGAQHHQRWRASFPNQIDEHLSGPTGGAIVSSRALAPAGSRTATAASPGPIPPVDKSLLSLRIGPNDVGTAGGELFSHPIVSPVEMVEATDDSLPVSPES